MVFFVGAFAQPGVLDVTFGNRGKVNTQIQDSVAFSNVPWSMIVQPDGKILTAGNTKINGIIFTAILRYNANGSLDNSFGNQGKVFSKDSLAFLAYEDQMTAIALQPDGKILYTRKVGDFLIKRLNSNGSPDSTFGTNGTVRTDWGTEEFSMSVKVKPNGKILVGGNNSNFNNTFPNNYVGVYVVQYNTNGTIDSSFGINGKAFYPTSDFQNIVFGVWDMKVQPDQKIVVSGTFQDNPGPFAVLRFNANGTLDSTFGNAGISKTVISGVNNNPTSMVLQPDGKIVLAGWGAATLTTPKNKISLIRLLPSGIPDSSFGINGNVITSISSESDMPNTVNLQTDGKIIVGGVVNFNANVFSPPYSNTGDFGLVRYNTDGNIDSAYGRHGVVTTDFSKVDIAFSSAIQADGKIVMAGVSDYYYNPKFALARYDNVSPSKYNTIKGSVFLDQNYNSIKDAGEPIVNDASVEVTKPNIDTIITNTYNGDFLISIDTGKYITRVVPYRPYFTVVPVSFTINHPTYFNTDDISFALQPIPGKHDLAVEVVAAWPTIPGFENLYAISFHNNGTDTVTSGVVQYVKSSKYSYMGASQSPSSINGDTLRWNFTNLNPLETRSILLYCRLQPPPSVNIGDTLQSVASISTNLTDLTPTDNTLNLKQIAQGAFDPNDKTENHGGKISTTQVANGDYLHYTIRFQNTGNDTAFNVYIRDTLDNKLDWNTMQTIVSSHNFQMNRNDGNRCLFTFRNINLVDSNKNEPKSHGYIVYKIKAKPNVQIGNVIKNTAAIYFDYNLPIITNTEMTTVVAEVLPLKLLSFKGNRLSQGNVYLHWQTAHEENTKSFEIEQSSNGRSFEKVGELKAYGNGNHIYTYTTNKAIMGNVYFRLKMMDKDGKFTYAPIVLIKAGDVKGSFVLGANPVNDKLVINAINPSLLNTEAALINSVGVVVKRFVLNGASQTVGVGNLPAGSYYLRTQQGSERVVIVR